MLLRSFSMLRIPLARGLQTGAPPVSVHRCSVPARVYPLTIPRLLSVQLRPRALPRPRALLSQSLHVSSCHPGGERYLRANVVRVAVISVVQAPHARNPVPLPAADTVASMLALHHKINYALIAMTPLALLVSPSPMVTPFDFALGIVLPIHSHIAMNMVVTDYAKKLFGKGAIMPSRYAMLALTGSTILGLTKLNMSGPGITETIKSFWRPKEA